MHSAPVPLLLQTEDHVLMRTVDEKSHSSMLAEQLLQYPKRELAFPQDG